MGNTDMADIVTPWQAWALLALYVVWAALLLGGFALGRVTPDGAQRMPVWTRMASSVTLTLIAWLSVYFLRATPLGRFALLIAFGMSLGLLGDLILAQVIPFPQHVLGGIAAFGLGHIAYLAAAIGLARKFGLAAPGPLWSMLALWLAIGAAGWYLVVFRGQDPTVIVWAALPYALLLATVVGIFTGAALQSSVVTPAAIGAFLFLVSDLILASHLFAGRSFPLIGDVIWLTYGPGQALIVGSVAIIALYSGIGLG
ncbi:MAG TPA: lysoplasmalogenase [Ktedonobacterales bacterium]